MTLLKRGETLHINTISRIFGTRVRRGITYCGSLRRGIRHVILIATFQKNPEDVIPYRDRARDKFLFYTGEGLVGNQKMERGNLVLKKQIKDGFPVFVFEKKEPGKYVFLGEFKVLGVRRETQPDIKGQKRKVFLFKLKRVSNEVSLSTQGYIHS